MWETKIIQSEYINKLNATAHISYGKVKMRNNNTKVNRLNVKHKRFKFLNDQNNKHQ